MNIPLITYLNILIINHKSPTTQIFIVWAASIDWSKVTFNGKDWRDWVWSYGQDHKVQLSSSWINLRI